MTEEQKKYFNNSELTQKFRKIFTKEERLNNLIEIWKKKGYTQNYINYIFKRREELNFRDKLNPLILQPTDYKILNPENLKIIKHVGFGYTSFYFQILIGKLELSVSLSMKLLDDENIKITKKQILDNQTPIEVLVIPSEKMINVWEENKFFIRIKAKFHTSE